MNRSRWLLSVLPLLLLPLLTVVVAGFAAAVLSRFPEGVSHGTLPGRILALSIGLGGICGAFGALIVLLWLRAAHEAATVAADYKRVLATLGRVSVELCDTREENELLTAMREVSRAVARGADFGAVLGDVLSILDGYATADAITLFLPEATSRVPDARCEGAGALGDLGDLEARAHLEHGRMRVGSIDTQELDPKHVLQTQATRRVGRALRHDGRQLVLTLPFDAGDAACGVLRIAKSFELDDERSARRAAIAPNTRGALTDGSAGQPAEQQRPPAAALALRRQAFASFERRIVYFVKHVALAVKHLALYDQATIDALTQLYNRRHCDEQMQNAIALARRQGSDLSLIIADIDHFKRVNDTFGHLAGDRVLTATAQILKRTVRAADLVFRYGGEEMCILSPGASAAEALVTAERVRAAIEAAHFEDDDGRPIPVTFSLGVAELGPDTADTSALFARADAALYAAKEGGRNRVCAAPPADEVLPVESARAA